jgi:hypothetical protein
MWTTIGLPREYISPRLAGANIGPSDFCETLLSVHTPGSQFKGE